MTPTQHNSAVCGERRIRKDQLDRLIEILRDQAYTVLGPKFEEGAIVYGEINALSELPRGCRDVQEPGKYRVLQTEGGNYFEFNVGPHSWKQFLFPPKLTIGTSKRQESGWTFDHPIEPQPKFAFVGVRACELAAIEVQDRVFLNGPYVDPIYKARRESVLIIAVNCTVAAATCFCTSTNSGPECRSSFDMALTELDDAFVVSVGSERGATLLAMLESCSATSTDLQAAEQYRQRAVEQITKRLDTTDIRNLLLDNLEHSHWDQVANRCLSCTNCTMVCPTCFCSSVSDVSDLAGDNVERVRVWDSCFNIDLSYTASGVVRHDRRSRFRQWLTHKLASWQDQFETSGCIGCGRCITWCPVGIDLTEEVAAIRNSPSTHRTLPIVQLSPNTACNVERKV